MPSATKTFNRYRDQEQEIVEKINQYEVDTTAPQPPPGTPFIPIDGTGPFARQPPVPTWDKRTADPTSEYVGAQAVPFLSNYVRALPPYIDDVTRDFGSDLYERMMYDAQCYACVHTLKMEALAENLHIVPIIEDKEDPQYEKAKEYAEFCQRCIDALPTDIHTTLYQMMDAFHLGNKVAEKTFRIAEDGKDSGQMVLDCIKVKDRGTVAFVVDVFYNIIGLLGIIPGQGFPVLIGTVAGNPDFIPNLLPREKFMVLTNNPRDEEPRGSSIFRAAYDPWYLKQQTKPEYLRYLVQFACPSLIGFTAPEATAQPFTYNDGLGNPTGAPTITPEQAMANQLANIRNGYSAAFPSGASVQPLTVGTGSPFTESIDMWDRQITQAILMQALATMESEHQSRAATGEQKDIFDVVIGHFRRQVCAMLRRDLLYYLIYYNYGKEEAIALTPKAVLGSLAKEDFPSTATAIGTLYSSGYLSPSQIPACDERLHLPARKDDNPQEPAHPLVAAQAAQANANAKATSSEAASGSSQETQGQGHELSSNFDIDLVSLDAAWKRFTKLADATQQLIDRKRGFLPSIQTPRDVCKTEVNFERIAWEHYQRAA